MDTVEELATTLELAARNVRSGTSLTLALAEAGATSWEPVRELVEDLLRAAEVEPIGAACRTWAGRNPGPHVALVAVAVGVAASGAGSPARALDAAARSLRERRAALAEARSWSTQARLSAVVLAVVPMAFAVLGVASGSVRVSAVLSQPAAVGSAVVGLVLEGVGAAWMWWLVRGATR